jgi:hypothetical protein
LQTAAGGQAISIAAQNVTNNVAAVNQPPAVSISSPTKSESFIAPATIMIDAVATDPDGSIIKVEFFNGSVKLGESMSIPYSYTWKNVPEGIYSITAVANDNSNLSTVSSPVSVVVEKSSTVINQFPVINITSPSKDKKFRKNEKIVIEAVATDADGSISKVEFKSGNVILQEVIAAPYIFVWEPSDTGVYVISATAIDNAGAFATSSLEMIIDGIYNEYTEMIELYPNPNNGRFRVEFSSIPPDAESIVNIASPSGAVVYNGMIDASAYSKEIDISDLSSGTYILFITSDRKIIATKKFIKQ